MAGRVLTRERVGDGRGAFRRRECIGEGVAGEFIAYRTIVADADSVCPALTADARLTRDSRVPVYGFEDDDGDSAPFLPPQFPWGALHVAEAGYVLDTSTDAASAFEALMSRMSTPR